MTNEDHASIFASYVGAAENIASSGRWDALNNKIRHHAGRPHPGSEWYLQVFSGLCYQTFQEYLLLKRSHSETGLNNTTALAWRSRNLLELLVWANYFGASEVNARCLYEDAGRDALDAFGAFEKWIAQTAQSAVQEPLKDEKRDLLKRASNEGIASLDGPFKRVAGAAAECGLSESFSFFNKLLSKFAHPTAMQILGVSDDTKISLQQDYFFSHGCLFFSETISALEKVSFVGWP